jgi:hypothetical protein
VSRRRYLIRGAWLLWLGALVAGVAYVGVLLGMGSRWSPFCGASGDDSNYGSLHWQWFPPGFYCTWSYRDNGFEAREAVGWHMSAYLVVMSASGAALAVSTGRHTTDDQETFAPLRHRR